MVADTKTQRKYKITTNASTLGELKQCLADNNIDYNGMSFTEGITKTTLVDDNAALPTNIPYKGTTTNNLVLLLTNTRKNIASGAMDRKAAYTLIKRYDLQGAVKATCGRNFTQVPTELLEEIINIHCGRNTRCGGEEKKDKEEKRITGSVVELKDVDMNMVDIITSLCKRLHDNGVLDSGDLADIADAINGYEKSVEDDVDALIASI